MSRNISQSEWFEETFQKLQHVTAQIETSLRTALAEKGLTLGGLILLRILMSRGGPTTATELANEMMVTNGAITGFMDKLEADGLITRTRMPLDRRIVLVEPTGKARTQFERIHFVAIDELSHAFKGWDKGDIKKLQGLLNRLMIPNKELRVNSRKTNGDAPISSRL